MLTHCGVCTRHVLLLFLGALGAAAGCGSHSDRARQADAQIDSGVTSGDPDSGESGDGAHASGPRVLVQDLGDKTLSAIRDGYLYVKPGLERMPLSAPRDESGQISVAAIEKVWPEASPFSETWFIGGRAYWIGLRKLFSWPLAGGDVQTTELPAVNWYSLAANQRYLFLTTLGCKRIRRIDLASGEVLDKDNLVMPRVEGGPTLYASEERVYCTAATDGRLWSVNAELQELRTHVEDQPRESVRLSLADDGYLYFQEDFATSGRVSRMNLKNETIEVLFEGSGWAMSRVRKLDATRVAWLGAQSLFVFDLPNRSVREFGKDSYFKFGDYSTPGVDLLFDADNVYWIRVDEKGGHLMVTPRSYFGF